MTREELLQQLAESKTGTELPKIKVVVNTDYSVKAKKEYSYVSLMADVIDNNGVANSTEVQRVFVDDKTMQLLKILGK